MALQDGDCTKEPQPNIDEAIDWAEILPII
jgi:hypothetical protein